MVEVECHEGGSVTEGTAFRKLLTIASTKGSKVNLPSTNDWKEKMLGSAHQS